MTSTTLSTDSLPMHIDGEDIGWISGILLALGGLWKGITFSLGRREKRIDNRFDAYLARIEAERIAWIARAERAEEQNKKLLIIIQMMAAEIERMNPASNILAHARAVMAMIPEPDMSQAIREAAERLEESR